MVYSLDVQLSKSRVIYRTATNEFKKFTDGVLVFLDSHYVFTQLESWRYYSWTNNKGESLQITMFFCCLQTAFVQTDATL